AAPLFAELWDAQPNAQLGWRYVQCLRETQRLDEAESVARKAMELFPNDSLTAKHLAWTLQDKKQYEEAASLFAAQWQKAPDKFIARSYAFCLRKQGNFDQAEQIARRGLEIDQSNRYLVDELIWILYEKKLKPAKEDSDLGLILQAA